MKQKIHFFHFHLNENAHTKVTKEAKAKFRKPFDKLEAGHSLRKNRFLTYNILPVKNLKFNISDIP